MYARAREMERVSVLDDVIERATEGRGCSAVQSHCLTYGQIHHPLFHGYLPGKHG